MSDPETGMISVVTTTTAAAFRYAAEKGNFAQNVKWLNSFLKNRGNGMLVYGVGFSIAAGVSATNANIDTSALIAWAQNEGRAATILAGTALTNILRGTARALPEGSIPQKALDTAAIIVAVSAVNYSAGHVEFSDSKTINTYLGYGRDTTFFGAGIWQIKDLFTPAEKKSKISPDLIIGGACMENAALAETTLQSIANIFYGLAYGSIYALKEHKGVYQWAKQCCSRKNNKPPKDLLVPAPSV